MLKLGVHLKVFKERLDHAIISATIDLYSYVTPGLQEAAARGFDDMVLPRHKNEPVGKPH